MPDSDYRARLDAFLFCPGKVFSPAEAIGFLGIGLFPEAEADFFMHTPRKGSYALTGIRGGAASREKIFPA